MLTKGCMDPKWLRNEGGKEVWLFKELEAAWTPILKKLSAATEGYDKLDYFKADEELD